MFASEKSILAGKGFVHRGNESEVQKSAFTGPLVPIHRLMGGHTDEK